MTDIKAYKMIWLSDRLHLITYGRTITGDNYYAMQRGPVPSFTKNMVNHTSKYPYFSSIFSVKNKLLIQESQSGTEYLSETDIEILNTIVAVFGNKTEDDLSQFSHYSPEWAKCSDKISHGKKRVKIDILDMFEEFIEPNSLFRNTEIVECSKMVYLGI